MERYSDYYVDQVGGGGAEIHVANSQQRGSGIGSFLGGLVRRAIPLIKKGSRAVGKEAVRAGVRVAKDHVFEKIPFEDAVSNRTRESRDRLKKKAIKKISNMIGGGYKRTRKRKTTQSRRVSRRSKTVKKKKRRVAVKKINRRKRGSATKRRTTAAKKRKIEDIFS